MKKINRRNFLLGGAGVVAAVALSSKGVRTQLMLSADTSPEGSIPGLVIFPVTLKKGTYDLGSCIVLPTGSITCEPGVQINARKDASLISFGELNFNGSREEPIVIAGDNDKFWKGMNIRTTKATFSYTEISGADVAVKSHHSDVMLEHVRITEAGKMAVLGRGGVLSVRNSHLQGRKHVGDDINVNLVAIRGSEFVLEETVLICSQSAQKIDAIDVGNCSRGVINNNILIGSSQKDTDGIDVDDYSSNIEISGNFITAFDDKAISVGESSRCHVEGNVFHQCGIGIGAKDGAKVEADKNSYIQLKLALKCYREVLEIEELSYINSRKPLFYDVAKQQFVDRDRCSISVEDGLSDKVEASVSFKNIERWDFRLNEISLMSYGANKDFSSFKALIERLGS